MIVSIKIMTRLNLYKFQQCLETLKLIQIPVMIMKEQEMVYGRTMIMILKDLS